MSEIKHQIILGNCGNDINSDLVPLPKPPHYRADTTEIYADNMELTADYSL